MNIYENILHLLPLILMVLSFGMVLGLVSFRSMVKVLTMVVFIPVALVLIKQMLPLIQIQYGNLGVFIALTSLVVFIMSCFSFTRIILASICSAFLYQHIHIILLATGVLYFTTSWARKLADWITQ